MLDKPLAERKQAGVEKMEAPATHGQAVPVLFVIFQSGNRADGGVESITQVIEHAGGIRPLIVTQRETPVNARWRAAGAEVRVWDLTHPLGTPDGRRIRQGVELVRSNVRMARLVERTGHGVVHTNDIRAFWHTAFGARLAGAQVVFNVRDVFREGRRYGWNWKVARHVSRCVLVISREMRDAVTRRLTGFFDTGRDGRLGAEQGRGVSSRPAEAVRSTEYIYSIVDGETMHPPTSEENRRALRKARGMGAEELALGYVATFNDKKAQLHFIEEAAPLIAERLPSATVYFVGDFDPGRDAYARRCREVVRNQGLAETVEFVGYVENVGDWYRAFDGVLLASQREGMARCMIESLACGTPVVSFDVCSAHEILDGYDCGHVVPQGDYGAFVRAAEALAADAARRQQQGENGQWAARKLFAPETVVAEYERLYRTVASS
jgi:glycosyltransferase involved in cell wall biosynthesis